MAAAGARASLPPGYRLDVADMDCDIGRFVIEKSAGVQEAATARVSEASRHLSAALAEWRGPVLEDLRDLQFVDAFAPRSWRTKWWPTPTGRRPR